MPHEPTRGPAAVALALACLAALAAATAPAAAEPPSGEAWVLLREVRQALSGQARTARFVQSFLPAGFTSGERESGRVAMELPGCLRWDYETPYAKTFLLCGDTVHAWNEGEESGRRYRIEAAEERGLDLLRLSAERLERRYDAALSATGSGAPEIVLTPREADGDVARATLRVNPEHTLLVGLSLEDVEGNLTRFELTDYAPLTPGSAFAPPAGMEWIAEDGESP